MCHRFASRASISFCALALLSAASLLAPRTAIAQTYTFSQTAAGTYFWAAPANWGGSGPPNAIGDIANLGGTGGVSKTVNITTSTTVGTINLSGTDSYTIAQGGGGSLILNAIGANATAIITNAVNAASQTISAPITLTDDHLSITQNSTFGGLTLGNIQISTAHVITLAGGGNTTFGGITVSNTGANGTLTITNTTVGTAGDLHITGGISHLDPTRNLQLTISGTAMNTTIDGFVNLFPTAAFGGGSLTVSNGGTTTFGGGVLGNVLQVRDNSTVILGGASTFSSTALGNNVASTLSANAAAALGTVAFSRGRLVVNANGVTWEGPTVTWGTDNYLYVGDGVTFGRNLAGVRVTLDAGASAGKAIIGTGNNATFESDIVFGGTNVLPVGTDGTLTFTGNFTGTGSALMNKTGSGTLVLAGTNSFGGGVSVQGGGLRLFGNTTISGALTVGAGATGEINATTTLGSLALGSATQIIGTAQINLLGDVSAGVASGLTSTIAAGPLNLGAADRTFTVVNSTLVDAELVIDSAIFGSGGLVKASTGQLALTHVSNTFSGNVTISAGVLEVKKLALNDLASSIGTGSTLTMGAATTLLYSGSGGDTTNRTINITGTSVSIINDGAGTITLSGTITSPIATTITLGGASNIHIGTLTQSTALALNVIKAGANTVTLATTSYTGATTVHEGTLRLGNTITTTGITLGNFSPTTANQTARLDLGGNTQVITGTLALYGTSAGNGVTANLSNGTLSFNSAIASPITLNVANQVGTAVISANLDFGSAVRTITFLNNPNVGLELDISGKIMGSGTFTFQGGTGLGGTMRLSNAANSYTGMIAVNGGSNGLTAVTLEVTNLRSSSLDSDSLGALGSTTMLYGDGGIKYVGVSGITTNRNFILNDNSEQQRLLSDVDITFAGNIEGFNSGSAHNRNLYIGGAGNITYSGLLGATTGGGTDFISVNKVGTGTLTLSPGSRGQKWVPTGSISVIEGTMIYNVGTGAFTDDEKFGLLRLGTSNTTASLDLRTSLQFSTVTIGGPVNTNTHYTTGSLAQANLMGNSGITATLTGNLSYLSANDPLGAVISVPTFALGTQTFLVEDSANTTSELRITSDITGTSLTKSGAGALELAGSNPMTITLTGGTLRLDYRTNTSSKLADTGTALTFSSATSTPLRLEVVGNNSVNTTETANAVNLLASSGNATYISTIISVNGGTSATTTLALGNITNANNSLVNFQTNATGRLTTSNSGTAGIVGAWARFGAANDTWAALDSSTGLITQFTNWQLQNNVASWTDGMHVSNNGGGFSGTTAGNLTVGSLRFNSAANSTITIASGTTLTVESGGLMFTSAVGSGNTTITGGQLRVGGTNDLSVQQDNTGTLTIASNIVGFGGLYKYGPGSLVLSGKNTYAGPTTIYEGAVDVRGGFAVPDSSNVTLSAGATLNVVQTEAMNLSWALGDINISSNQALWISERFSAGTTQANITGTITGDASTTFARAGTGSTGTVVIVNGTNNFNGTTLINAGRFQYTGTGLNGPIVINNGGILEMSTLTSVVNFDRIGDTSSVTLFNGTFSFSVAAGTGATYSEQFGTLILSGGANTVTMSNVSTTPNFRNLTLTASGFTRSNNGTLVVVGTNLGTATNPTTSLYIGASLPSGSTLVGGAAGGASSAIAPWAVGGTVATSSPTGFLTYGATGFRTLTSAEAIPYASAATGNNATISAAASGLTGKTINSLVISGAATSYSATGAAGQTLTVSSGGILFSSSGVGNLTFGGFDAIVPGTTYNSHYIFTYPTTVTITSVLANSTSGGTALVKAGTGNLVLRANNSYTGDTYLNQGIVNIDSLLRLGPNNTQTIYFAGGALQLDNTFSGDPSVRPMTFLDDAIFLFGVPGTDSASGGITMTNSIGGGGAGGLQFRNSGAGGTQNTTLTLSGNNTYRGSTTIQNVSGIRAVAVATFGNEGGGASPLGDTPLGYRDPKSGLLGSIVLDGGTIRFTGAVDETTNRGIIVVGSVSAAVSSINVTNASVTLTFDRTAGGGSGGDAVQVASPIAYAGGFTITTAGTVVFNSPVNLANNVLTLNGTSLSGRVILNADGNQLAGIQVTNTTLQLNGNSRISPAATITLSATGNGGTLELGDGVTIYNTLAINSIGNERYLTMMTGASNATYAGTINPSDSYEPAFTITVGSGQNLTLSGVITGNGVTPQLVGIKKNGAGTVFITGQTNSVQGGLIVTAGILDIKKLANGGLVSSIGDGTVNNTLSFNGTIGSSGTLRYSGTGDTTDRVVSLANAGAIENVGSGTLTWSGSFTGLSTNNSLTFGGTNDIVVSGTIGNSTFTLSLNKTGSGTVSLSNAANDYKGSTTIAGGILDVSKLADANVVSSLGTGSNSGSSNAPIVLTGGTLRYSGSGDSTNRVFDVTTSGSIANNGSGTLSLTGTITGRNNATLTFAGSNDIFVASALSQSGGTTLGMTKAGNGTLTLNGTNIYTGPTNVLAGILYLNGGSLAAGSNVTISGGSLRGTGTVNGATTLSGGTISLGSGGSIANVLNVTGGGTWSGLGSVSGNVTVSGGTFTVNSALTSGGVYVTGGTLAGNSAVNGSVTTLSGGTISFASGGNIAGALNVLGGSWNGIGSVVGATTVSSGTFTVGGTLSTSALDVASTLNVGGTITGSANITGTVNGAGSIHGNSTLSGGTISFASGGQIAGTLFTDGGNWNGAGGVTGLVTQNGGTFNVNGGANLDASGGYNLVSGNLFTNGSIGGNVTVAGGTLGGSGAINGTVTVNSGDLSPGNSPGTLTLGDLDMNGGNYVWQLADLTTSGPGTNFDFVIVDAGDADLSNAANVVLDFSLLATLDQPGVDNAFWLSDHVWTILSVTGGGLVNGTFADLNQIVDLGGFGTGVFSLGYDTTNVFLNYNVAAVPEPGSLLLATLGAAGFGLRRWRKKNRVTV